MAVFLLPEPLFMPRPLWLGATSWRGVWRLCPHVLIASDAAGASDQTHSTMGASAAHSRVRDPHTPLSSSAQFARNASCRSSEAPAASPAISTCGQSRQTPRHDVAPSHSGLGMKSGSGSKKTATADETVQYSRKRTRFSESAPLN